MANFANPTVGSAYTSFPTEIRDAVTAALQQLHVGSHTNIPANSIKWDSSDNRWKKYIDSDGNGTFEFVDLTSTYAFNAQISATQLNLGDAQKIILGQHNDFEIVHDVNNSVIRETGTGSLFLQSNDSIFLGQTNGTSQYIEATPNSVILKAGNAEKFKVDSGGVILGDSVSLRIGASGDLTLRHDTNNSYIEDIGEGALIFKSNTYSFRNAADSEQIAVFNEGGHVALYHANSARLFTQSYGVAIDGDALLVANSTASAKRIEIRYGTNFTARLEASAVGVFQIQAYSGTAWYPAIEVNANGTVEINHSSNATKRLETTASGVKVTQLFLADSTNSNDNAVIFGDQSDMRLYHDGGNGVFQNDTGNLFIQNAASNQSAIFIRPKAGDQGIQANHNGGVLLHFANTLKFETINTGAALRTGNSNPADSSWETGSGLILDGSYGGGIAFKDGTHGGATMFVHDFGAQWALRMAAANATPVNAITADRNAAVKLHHGGYLKLETTNSGCVITGNISCILNNSFVELNASDGSIEIRRSNGDPFIDFKVNNVDNEARLVLLSGQNNKLESTTGYFVGDFISGSNVKYFSAGNSQDMQLYHDGSTNHSVIKNSTQNLYYVTQHTHVFQNTNAVINAQFESAGRALLNFSGNPRFETTARGTKFTGDSNNPFGTAWATDCALNIRGTHGGGISMNDNDYGGVILAVTNFGNDFYVRNNALNATPINQIFAARTGRVALFHNGTEQFASSQFGIQVRHPNGTTTNRNPAYGTALIDGTQSNPVLKSFNLGVTDHGTGDYEITFANHGGTHTVTVFGNSIDNFITNDGHGAIYVTSESATQVRFIICREIASQNKMDKTRLGVAIFTS